MDGVYDVIVVGGGPGGYSAALYSARAGLSTLVLEAMAPGGQMATTERVDNYPGFNDGVDGYELAEKMKAGAERFGAVTKFAQVSKTELSGSPKLVYAGDTVYKASTVIIATGASPRELGIEGERELRGRGVSYCATCDGNFFRNKTVAVCGGGNSAAADALTLSKLCTKVYLVHRRDTLRAFASYVKPLETAGNIEFVWNAQIDAILHDKRVTGLAITDKVTGQKSTLNCDGVFVAIGRVPVVDFLEEQLTLGADGGIAAEETTETNIPGVFAAGDVRTKAVRQIVTAAADGAVAASFAEMYIALSS